MTKKIQSCIVDAVDDFADEHKDVLGGTEETIKVGNFLGGLNFVSHNTKVISAHSKKTEETKQNKDKWGKEGKFETKKESWE